MKIDGINVVVTGGASGLGLACALRLIEHGASVTLLDLASSEGPARAAELGDKAHFVPCDITDESQVAAAFAEAETLGPVRALVHCAGRGKPMRILDKEGNPGSAESFAMVIGLNVIGTFTVLRYAAASMAKNELLDGDRGVIILTASVAAFEGQIGQINYAAAKAAVVGMTLPAARDLAGTQIRVCTIAPGTFATPLLTNSGRPDIVDALAASVPHPKRLGDPDEFAALAEHIIEEWVVPESP